METTSIPYNTDTVIASVTLPAGSYVLSLSAQLNGNATANGYVVFYLTNFQPQVWAKGEANEALSNYGRFVATACRSFSSQRTIQLIAHQTTHQNGTTVSNIVLSAMRIK